MYKHEPSILVSGPNLTSVILWCFLIKLLTAFGAWLFTVASGFTVFSTTAHAASSHTTCSFSNAPCAIILNGIWISIPLPSSIFILITPVLLPDAFFTVLIGATFLATKPSSISPTTDVKAGTSFTNFLPITSFTVNTSSFNAIKFESTILSKCIGFSKSAVSITSPAFLLYFNTAFAFSSNSTASAALVTFFMLSNISGVIGVNESIVLINFAPNTSCIVKQSAGIFKSPESFNSSNIAGSSKLAAEITVPASALQQTMASSVLISSICSAFNDIFYLLYILILVFLLIRDQLF